MYLQRRSLWHFSYLCVGRPEVLPRAPYPPPQGGVSFLGGKKSAHSRINRLGMKAAQEKIGHGGFVIKAGELKEALGRFEHVMPKNAFGGIYGYILLEQSGDMLGLKGGADDLSAYLALRVQPRDEGYDEVRIAVPYRQLVDFAKRIPSAADIVFTRARDENFVPYLLANSSYENATFRGIDAHKYPSHRKADAGYYVAIDVDIFREMVSSTAFAAAGTSYYNLRSVYFNFLSDRTDFVATNRVILSLYSRTDVVFSKMGDEKAVIMPVKALQAFVRGIRGLSFDEKVEMFISKDRVQLRYGSFTLNSVIIDGSYLPYQSVIPIKTAYMAVFERTRLRDAIKQLLPPKYRGIIRVNFIFEGDSVMISVPDEENKTICMEKVLRKSDSENLKVGFNARLLLRILENVKSDRVVMRMFSPNRPVVIEPEDQTPPVNRLCLIMPLAVRD
jgi:DNA polymerase-3 subunit beta